MGSPGDLLDIVVELGGTLAHVWLLEGVVGLGDVLAMHISYYLLLKGSMLLTDIRSEANIIFGHLTHLFLMNQRFLM